MWSLKNDSAEYNGTITAISDTIKIAVAIAISQIPLRDVDGIWVRSKKRKTRRMWMDTNESVSGSSSSLKHNAYKPKKDC